MVFWFGCALLGAPGSGAAEPEKITLREALERAAMRNPSVQVAAAEVLRAEGLVEQTRSESFPAVTANGGYTRIDAARKFGNQVFIPQGSTTGGLVVTAPVVVPRSWAAWAHSLDNRSVAGLSASDVRRQVAIAVANAYLDVIAARRQAELNERARDSAKAHFDFAAKRREGGAGSRLDEARGAQELSTDESLLEAARLALSRSREALGVLLGNDAPLDAAEEPAFELPPDPLAVDLVSVRSDLRVLAESLQAAKNAARDDWTDYMPSLNAQYERLYQNPPIPTQPLWSWRAGLFLSLPIYDGGARYGLSKQRKASVLEAEAKLDGALRQARSEVRRDSEAVQRTAAALSAATAAASRAREVFDITKLAYGAGARTNLEVIDAERQARDADTAASVAQDALERSRLELLTAVGRFP
jgi:outer membrane protein TolC